MNWLNRAEARFGHLAIPGLSRIIVGLNLIVYICYKLINQQYLEYLRLEPALVREGQVWRLFTFIFIPGFGSIFGEYVGLLCYLLFLHMVATGLEQAIGAFKFNVYYLTGMLCIMISSMFMGANFAPALLNATLLFGFARYFPEHVIYIFFILPVKIKWLAWLEAAGLVLMFLALGWDYRLPLLVTMGNYFAFFGGALYQEARLRSEVAARRIRFESDMRAAVAATLHECVVCGITEAKDPYMDFRVARDGKEYCAAHLPKVEAPSA